MLGSSGGYVVTPKAFIFSISNKEELAPFVSEWRQCYFPYFGDNIYIANDANSNNNSYARLGRYYPAPAAVQNPNTILAGTEYFSPDEVEFFFLVPTK